jgi:hypothetical protein
VVIGTEPEDPLKKDGAQKFSFRGEAKPTGALALDAELPATGIAAD